MPNRKVRDGRPAVTETIRTVILIIFLLAAIPLIILGFLYAIDLKREVELTRLDTAKIETEVIHQREIAQRQAEISQSMLEIAQRQAEISETILDISQSTDAKISRSLRLQEELLGISRDILEQAREINRKTPNAGQVNNLLGQ